MAKLRKQVKALLVAVPLATAAFVCYKEINNPTNKFVEFNDITNIEYGSTVDGSYLININKGKIVNFPTISTNTLGLQKIEYEIEYNRKIQKGSRTIQVVDTQLPVVELKSDIIELNNGDNFNPTDNIERIYDIVDGDLNTYEFIHNVDTSIAGDYEVLIKATDRNMNVGTAKYTVSVKESEVVTDEANGNQLRYIENILFINKKYSLPASYKGNNEEALNALKSLQEAAKNAGHELSLINGYISYSEQKKLYEDALNTQDFEIVNKTIEKPGHSEHQSGLAFDVGSTDEDFGNTEAGKWLAEHCAEYGFIIRYPKGKEHITGYDYSPSHIRYVGEKHAKLITRWGNALEEYLGVEI